MIALAAFCLVLIPAAYLYGYWQAKKALTPRDSWTMQRNASRINRRINREWHDAGPLQ